MKIKFEWEAIYFSEDIFGNLFQSTFRTKVIGGWLIRHDMMLDSEREKEYDGWSHSQNSMIFIPDPEHKWEIE